MKTNETNQDTSTEEQGQVSVPGKNPKDDSFREQAQKLFSGLNPEEMESLRAGLADIGKEKYPFSGLKKNAPLAVFLWLAMEQKEPAENEEAKLKECKHRDSLTGQAKVDFVLEKLRTEGIGLYRASFQREILELIRDDKPIPSKEHYTFRAKKINERFEGCNKSFRRKVINQYLTKVLPEMETTQREEDADQEATDKLLALTVGKTPKQIRDMTALLKNSKLTS